MLFLTGVVRILCNVLMYETMTSVNDRKWPNVRWNELGTAVNM